MSDSLHHENLLTDDPWGIPLKGVRLSDSFDEIVAKNPELKIEQNANGETVFMSPTGGESGYKNLRIASQLDQWSERFGGRSFDSSTLFRRPNGAKRSPDTSWISLERWNTFTKEDRKKFPPLCPHRSHRVHL